MRQSLCALLLIFVCSIGTIAGELSLQPRKYTNERNGIQYDYYPDAYFEHLNTTFCHGAVTIEEHQESCEAAVKYLVWNWNSLHYRAQMLPSYASRESHSKIQDDAAKLFDEAANFEADHKILLEPLKLTTGHF